MEKKTVYEKVIAMLIKNGQNMESAKEIAKGENYEFAIRNNTAPKKIVECIMFLM